MRRNIRNGSSLVGKPVVAFLSLWLVVVFWICTPSSIQGQSFKYQYGLELGANVVGDDYTDNLRNYLIRPYGTAFLEYYLSTSFGLHLSIGGGTFGNDAGLRQYRSAFGYAQGGLMYKFFPEDLAIIPGIFARAGIMEKKVLVNRGNLAFEPDFKPIFLTSLGGSLDYKIADRLALRLSLTVTLTSTDYLDGYIGGKRNDGFTTLSIGFSWLAYKPPFFPEDGAPTPYSPQVPITIPPRHELPQPQQEIPNIVPPPQVESVSYFSRIKDCENTIDLDLAHVGRLVIESPTASVSRAGNRSNRGSSPARNSHVTGTNGRERSREEIIEQTLRPAFGSNAAGVAQLLDETAIMAEENGKNILINVWEAPEPVFTSADSTEDPELRKQMSAAPIFDDNIREDDKSSVMRDHLARAFTAHQAVQNYYAARDLRNMKVSVLTGEIYFAFARWDLSPDARYLVDEFVQQLKNFPVDDDVEIAGYTDERGAEAFNFELSDKRADAVRRLMSISGVPHERLTTEAMGPQTIPPWTCRPKEFPRHRRAAVSLSRQY